MTRYYRRTFFYKKPDKKDGTTKNTSSNGNVCTYGIIAVLVLWTLWGIYHFSSIMIPSIVHKMIPTTLQQEDGDKDTESGFNTEADEEEIFRKQMELISGPTCKGPAGILLLKTHKTGSSTLANILNRYAEQNKLTVALPKRQTRFDWPQIFRVDSADKKLMNGREARVLTNHARLNREAMDKVMVPGTFYISILRNPVQQYESAFYYLNLHRLFGLSLSINPLEEFMDTPQRFMDKIEKSSEKPEDAGLYRNGMLFDLGYDELELKRVGGVDNAIENLKKEINLFLFLEYFDESLVLLKKEMCWSIENILYFKQNQRTTKLPINAQCVERIKEWNSADMKLYQHFNQTFWQKVKDYGPNFQEDVKEFRYYLKQWWKRCDKREVVKGLEASAVRFYKVGHKVKEADAPVCERFFRTELQYLSFFRARSMQEFYSRYQKKDQLNQIQNIRTDRIKKKS